MTHRNHALISAVVAFLMCSTLASTARADEADASAADWPAVSVYVPGVAGSPYRSGDPVPPDYHVETRVRRSLAIASALTFGIPYLLSAVVGATSPGGRSLLVPVAGPLLQVAAPQPNRDSIARAATAVPEAFLLTVDFIAQAAGTALLAVALVWQKDVLVRDDGVALRPTPMRLGSDGAGLGLMGSF
jgi:hypothetical protein